MSQQLPPTREASNGNFINRSSRFVFARRRWLGVFPLAQELALSLRRGKAQIVNPSLDYLCGQPGCNSFMR